MPTPAPCRPYAGRHPALSPSPTGRGAAAPFAPRGPACPHAPPCPAARRARRIFSPVPRVAIAVTRPREPSTAGEDARGHVVFQGRGEDGEGCRAVELGWWVPTSLPLSAGGGRAISLSRKVMMKVRESRDNRQGWRVGGSMGLHLSVFVLWHGWGLMPAALGCPVPQHWSDRTLRDPHVHLFLSAPSLCLASEVPPPMAEETP